MDINTAYISMAANVAKQKERNTQTGQNKASMGYLIQSRMM